MESEKVHKGPICAIIFELTEGSYKHLYILDISPARANTPA